MVKVLLSYQSKIGGNCASTKQEDKYTATTDRKKFAISRLDNGEVLSRYEDDIWDFSPYRPRAYLGSCKVSFKNKRSIHIPTAKKILFTIIYLSSKHGRSHTLKPSTIVWYYEVLNPICNFADKNQKSLLDVLINKEIFTQLLRELTKKSQILALRGILMHLRSVDPLLSKIEGLKQWQIELTTLKLSNFKPDNQTPIIPERIFSNLISQIFTSVEEFEKHSSQIFSLITKMDLDPLYGRTNNHQSSKVENRTKRRPNFWRATEIEGLTEYFTAKEVKDSKSLCNLVTKFQISILYLIMIFSGMRKSEAGTLTTNCLAKDQESGVTLIYGYSSKGNQDTRKTSWVTSPTISSFIELAAQLSAIILRSENLPPDELPLFPSSGRLSFGSRSGRIEDRSFIGVSNTSANTFRDSLNPIGLQIQPEDLNFLNIIDPFRDWNSDKKFELGMPWHITATQFRRSLAFYVAQSGIVSFSALKRQLKHVSRDMTMYYCQSHIAGRHGKEFYNGFHKFMLKVKPEADAAAFIHNILNTADPLLGAAGKKINTDRDRHGEYWVFKDGRSDLVSKFEKGLMAYSVTPLGACTTTKKCKKSPALSIAGCLNCSDAIIKSRSLDKTIMLMEKHIQKVEVNSTDNFVQRLDTEELIALKNFRERTKKGNANGS